MVNMFEDIKEKFASKYNKEKIKEAKKNEALVKKFGTSDKKKIERILKYSNLSDKDYKKLVKSDKAKNKLVELAVKSKMLYDKGKIVYDKNKKVYDKLSKSKIKKKSSKIMFGRFDSI